MKAEMVRSLESLRSESFGPPYFMAYRLVETQSWEQSASFGSALGLSRSRSRSVYVEVRVGSRTLDNTDLSYHGWNGPTAEDPAVLRQHLWILTDRGYKSAVSGFLEKKAKRATEHVPDVLDDFAVEEAAAAVEEAAPAPPEPEALRELLERMSAVLRENPDVIDGMATARVGQSRRYLLTSEGTRIAGPGGNVPGLLRLHAGTRSQDGMRLETSRSWTFRVISDLPSEPELIAEVRRLAGELTRLRSAPVQAPAAAPAMLDSEVTGVLFHEALGHKLEGQRQRDPQQSQLFKDLVGTRIIPDFLSLIDDPTLAFFGGRSLSGHYRFDDEGVPAQRVVLVDRGVLRNFLLSRWPVKGFGRSNGHGRSDSNRHPSGRMSNLIIESASPVSAARLKRRLLALAREKGLPYGFRLVGAFGGENPTGRGQAQTLEVRPRLVYRVDARTGEETLVRGVKMVGTPLVFLNRIVAASDRPVLADGFVCGAESGHVPVSQIAPEVLVAEVELQRLPEDRVIPPTLPSPFHDPPR